MGASFSVRRVAVQIEGGVWVSRVVGINGRDWSRPAPIHSPDADSAQTTPMTIQLLRGDRKFCRAGSL